MHIPDGYLSPSTCAVLYAAATPFWYVALQRMKMLLATRMLPLVSVFAAFSFVVMMFNIPLPYGTSGHAVGMAISTIVLGPWGSMLAISVALSIQALLFGDGGITTLGANCFNMAIAGSLVSYVVYRGVSHGAVVTSKRRVLAAALAGYLAINVSALLAGVELGVQPLLFTDADGVAMYFSYPLVISIPAMLIGHLTFAGFAEVIVSAGVVSYLQHTNPALLEWTSAQHGSVDTSRVRGWRAARPLLVALALLMVFTPLGLLAAGAAWGEWAPEDFKDPEKRALIQAASGDVPLPANVPKGLDELSSIWSAPLPEYKPAFLASRALGYILSAVLGAGLILSLFLVLSWLMPTFFGLQNSNAAVASNGHGASSPP